MGTFKDLKAYNQAFKLAMEIFLCSKKFPPDERFEITSQIRRSSRSVCSNIAEGYRKRKYQAHFISKMTDADMEITETMVWIEFAYHCEYISKEDKQGWLAKSESIGQLLSFMIKHPEKFNWKE
jgi:four helix bundle protein